MGAGLVSTRVNTRKSSNGVPVSEPGHIPNLRHELGAEGISHAAHGHDNWIFGKLGGQSAHFGFELLQRLGNSIQRVNGLPYHGFG